MLRGSVVVVTGGSRGIGRATAEFAAELGGIVIAGSRSGSDGVGQPSGPGPGRVHQVVLDVADHASVSSVIAGVEGELGPIDVLINNAAVMWPASALETTDVGEWEESVRINLFGAYYTMRAVLPGMIDRGHGAIVNVSSGAAVLPMPGWSAYCAAKAGLDQLSRVTAAEVRASRVRVNALYPGVVDTPMQAELRNLPEDGVAAGVVGELRRMHERGRLLSPRDAARAVCWLAGTWSEPRSGEVLSLDDPSLVRQISTDLGRAPS